MKSYITTGLAILGIAGLLFVGVRFGGLSSLSNVAGISQPDQSAEAQHSDLVGTHAPFFDLPDVSGNHVKLSGFADTPLVIVFWSTWNDKAADQMHILDQYLSTSDAHLPLAKIIAIDSQEEHSAVASFMRRGGYRVTTLIDATGATSEQYNIKSLPTTLFLDRAGVVRDAYAGVLSQTMLVDKIEHIVQ